MEEKEHLESTAEDQPEIYKVKKDLAGWQFDRRKFLTAAGATAAAATVAGAVSNCGEPQQVVVQVTETASPFPPTETLVPRETGEVTAEAAEPTQGAEPTTEQLPIQTPEPADTLPPTATSPPTSTTAPTSTPTPDRPRAEFVKDMTIPDGTTMRPNQAFTKTWRYRNNGTVPWGEGVKLTFVSGTIQGFASNKMGGPDFLNVPNVAPGENLDASLNLVAPARAGRYRSYWRLQLPNGEWLEENHYVEIVVRLPDTPTPPPTPTPECACVGHVGCGCDGDCGCDRDCGCDGDCGCDRDVHYWHPG